MPIISKTKKKFKKVVVTSLAVVTLHVVTKIIYYMIVKLKEHGTDK